MFRWMYDASTPPPVPPHLHVAAGYIGGDTPHVWTRAEWEAQWSPFRLPIFVHTGADTAQAGYGDADLIQAELEALEVPHGCAFAIDTETGIYQAYLRTIDEQLGRLWPPVNYGSLSVITRSYRPSGGRWCADWTDDIFAGLLLAERDGFKALQWASDVMLGKPYDLSVIDSSVKLWPR